jgi:hypothetical protein
MAKQYYFNNDFRQGFCAKCGQQFFGPRSQKHCDEHQTTGEPAITSASSLTSAVSETG